MSTMMWVAAGVVLGLFVFAVMQKLIKLALVMGLALLLGAIAWTTMRDAAGPVTASRMDHAADELSRKTGEAARRAADAARPVAERAAHAARAKSAEVASRVGEAVSDRVAVEFARGFGGDDDDSAETPTEPPASPEAPPAAPSNPKPARARGR